MVNEKKESWTVDIVDVLNIVGNASNYHKHVYDVWIGHKDKLSKLPKYLRGIPVSLCEKIARDAYIRYYELDVVYKELSKLKGFK